MSDVEKAIKGSPHNNDNNDNNEQHPDNDNNATATAVAKVATTTTTRTTSRTQRCLSHLLKIVCSTPGLVLLVIGYSVLGALIFPLLEAPQDLSKLAAIAKSREDCLRELWIITEKLNVLYERNWTMLVHEQLRRFEGSIVAATRQGVTGHVSGASTALGHFGYDGVASPMEHWTFSEALLYSVTVITTIGHGSLTPRTAAGKIATIFYALIGVPLMLMCLSSLGALLAEALQCTYVRLCCQLQRSHGVEKSALAVATSTNAANAAATTTATATKRRHAAANGANCKSCKYDAANSETCLNDCYEYGQKTTATTTTTTMTAKRKLSLQAAGEDACQLLHHAMPSKQQPYYQQQQQQQQQQQPPDVMLMTTATTAAAACGATAANALLKYATAQQNSQSQTHSHYINAMPLQQQHQQQQHQQQLSTATLPRAHHQQQQQQQQQTNFVAVPSSLLRFTGPPNSASPTPPNCYAPATATIYFPFASALGGSPQHGISGSQLTAAASVGTNCQQPLVKYHTIHLQPAAKRLLQPTTSVTSADDLTTINGDGLVTTAVSTLEAITLPPPPAYQTANVHAVRRAKFVSQPLSHEINTLLLEGATPADMSCRHDLLPHTLHATATSATATGHPGAGAALFSYSTSPQLSTTTGTAATSPAPAATTTMPDNSFMTAGVCGAALMSSSCSAAATPAATLSTLLSSSGNVDIMEDEDEHERERSSNCPHGTPSRVPLIASSGGLNLRHDASNSAEKSRSLLNATAASFHRHTLQPLNRKTLLLSRRCQKHAAAMYDSTATTETSDEEDGCGGRAYMQHGSEQFVLKKLHHNCHTDTDDGGEEQLEDEEDYELQQLEEAQQVPISIVLLILMCYICVGTVIFALWENWSLVDGAYFCFVTLSTIGYGDFVPTRSFNGPEVQLYACCAYLLLGLVLVAMSFSILETQLMWKCKRIAVRLKLAKD